MGEGPGDATGEGTGLLYGVDISDPLGLPGRWYGGGGGRR